MAEDSPSPLARGLELYKQGRLQEAEPLLLTALSQQPDDAEALIAVARLWLRRNEYEKAIPLAEKAVARAPASAQAHLVLAQAYGQKAGQVAKMRAMLLADDVKAHFEKATELDPNNVDAREGLIEFHLAAPKIMGGDTRQAKALANESMALDPMRGLRALARVHSRLGEDPEALAALDRLRAIDAGQGLLGRALHFLNKKDEAAAAAELVRVAQEDPRDAKDLSAAATMLQQSSRWEDALKLLDQARAADPAYLPAVYQVGRARLLSGSDLAKAEAAFLQYLSAETVPEGPPRFAALWRLGMVYENMGRAADARARYEEALRLDPTSEEAKKSLAALKR